MPILSKPKYELFAQELAKGTKAGAAYVAAGFNAHASNAVRLSKNEHVAARVAELLAVGAERAGVTVQRIVEELAKIGFANMADYMRAGEGGDPYLDFSALTRDQAAALSEVTVEDFKDGRGEEARDVRRIKFKMHDKLNALEKLGKHVGMFPNKVEVSGPNGGPVETKDVSARELITGKLNRIAARLRERGNPSGAK